MPVLKRLISSTSPTCWSVDFIGSANTTPILSYGKESDNVSVKSLILKPVSVINNKNKQS